MRGVGGGGPTRYGTRYNTNGNHHIDSWKDFVVTVDPCAYQLDEGDQLGSDCGGSNQKRPKHNSVDIQCEYGDPVYSIESGVATFEGYDDRRDEDGKPIGSGKYVIIHNDDGTEAQYLHLADNSLVHKDQRVAAGSLIARADSTGHSTGNHLHILVKDRPHGNYIEPLAFAETQPTSAERHGGC